MTTSCTEITEDSKGAEKANDAVGRILRDNLSERVIGLAIDVHRARGPGLFESAYCEYLAHDFFASRIRFEREVPVPLVYKSIELPCAYRLDFLIEDQLILEVKSIDAITPVHEAQLLTNLRPTGKQTGLLLNFKTARLKEGILRRVLTPLKNSATSVPSALSA